MIAKQSIPKTVSAQSVKSSAPSSVSPTEKIPEAFSPPPRSRTDFSLQGISIERPDQQAPARAAAERNHRVTGLSFFQDQRFSRSVAHRSVGTARRGRYPFGDEIAKETRGAVDPHAVPAVVVPELPGLGVCYDGKVALRSDAGIGVARHELAHALGGDEAAAEKASADSGYLASLASSGGAPVNGWAIGFEFQTVAHPNPKVYQLTMEKNWLNPPTYCQTHGLSLYQIADLQKEDAYQKMRSLSRGQVRDDVECLPTKGWKLTADGKDLEIVTSPVEETEAGRAQLAQTMSEIRARMDGIQDLARHGGEAMQGWPLRCIGDNPSEDRFGIAHASASNFTAHPQATLGVSFLAIPDLFRHLSSQVPRGKKGAWKRDQLGWKMSNSFQRQEQQGELSGQAALAKANKRVDRALGKAADDPAYARLRALLYLVAGYFAMGRHAQSTPTKQLKNIAAIMSRTNLHELYLEMNPAEQQLYQAMLEQPSKLAQVFGLKQNKLQGARLLRYGITPLPKPSSISKAQAKRWEEVERQRQQKLNPKLLDFLTQLPEEDIIASSLPSEEHQSMHAIDSHDFEEKMGKDARSVFDIGSGTVAKRREGLLLELRAMKRDVPWNQWGALALRVFDLAVSLNAKYEAPEPEKHEAPEPEKFEKGDTKDDPESLS